MACPSVRRLAAVVLLSVAVVAAALAEGQTEEKQLDISKVSPERLGGVDVGGILKEAQLAYGEKRYEAAARAYIQALRARPGDSGNLYNLACCYGLLRMDELAAQFVHAAWRAGFRDLDHIRRDPDFDLIRGKKAFDDVMGLLERAAEEQARAEGRRLFLRASVMWDVRVVEPAEREPGKRYPLVIGLHGFGADPEGFAGLFRSRKVEQSFYYCAVRAPYPWPRGKDIGYSWRPLGAAVPDPVSEQARAFVSQLVLGALDLMLQEYPVDKANVFLLGFSQGAGVTFSVGLRHPELFRGLIPVGGWADPDRLSPDEVAGAAKHALVLLCHSPEDTRVPFEEAEKALAFMEGAGIAHQLIRYPGGHRLPEDLVERIAAWLRKPEPGPALEIPAAEAR